MKAFTGLLLPVSLLCNLGHVYGGRSQWFCILECYYYDTVLFYYVYLAFEEVPQSQLVSVGDTATFRCRHGSADVIRWRVDQVLISADPSTDITPDIVREGDHIVHTLTIVARREYNGTEVECVARFDDHSPDEQTAPAILHILGMINALSESISMIDICTCIPIVWNNSKSMVLSLSLFPHLPPSLPPSLPVSVALFFSLSPLLPPSLSTVVMDGQFTEVPSSLNLTDGETAMFVCRHQSADHISWEVTPRWRYDQFEPTTVGGIYILSALLRDGINYNATTIQCKALFDDDLTQSTEPAILLVQGMCIHSVLFVLRDKIFMGVV